MNRTAQLFCIWAGPLFIVLFVVFVARTLHGRHGIECPPDEIETNIVYARLLRSRFDAETLRQRLEDHRIRAMVQAPRSLRFVTHMDVGPEDVVRLAEAIERIR